MMNLLIAVYCTSKSQDSDSPLMALNQIVQIQADLEAHRFQRPLLWLHNPKLVAAYCALPAVARVMHATENHFEYSDLPKRFQEQLRTCLELKRSRSGCEFRSIPRRRRQRATG